MPMYQYQCNDCAELLEVRQSFSDAALTECPSCGGHLRKVFGSVGVVFKGSGFYRTDSRSDSSTSTATSSSTSTPSSTSNSTSSASGDSPAA